MKQNCAVTVAGRVVNITTDESLEYVNKLSEVINKRVETITQNSSKCADIDAIILCAIEMLDSKMKTQLSLYECREELEKAQADNIMLKRELSQLRDKYLNGQ